MRRSLTILAAFFASIGGVLWFVTGQSSKTFAFQGLALVVFLISRAFPETSQHEPARETNYSPPPVPVAPAQLPNSPESDERIRAKVEDLLRLLGEEGIEVRLGEINVKPGYVQIDLLLVSSLDEMERPMEGLDKVAKRAGANWGLRTLSGGQYEGTRCVAFGVPNTAL